MRQVPSYLLIGNGRVARHMRHYFSLLNLPYSSWHRGEPIADLLSCIAHATHILVLISDHSIEPFIETHLRHTHATLIHCSGSLATPLAYSAHPLTTFSETLYPLEQYQHIPFILDKHYSPQNPLLPGLPNRHFYLDPNQKAKYHALCVASGNFSCLLWQKLFHTFETEFALPREVAHIYLQQQMQNLIDDPYHALTGPLIRNDQQTLQKNIDALDNDPLQKIYQSFIDYYATTRKEK